MRSDLEKKNNKIRFKISVFSNGVKKQFSMFSYVILNDQSSNIDRLHV